MKKYTFFALLFIFSLFITGCGISTQKEIRIGATSGPHAEIAEIVAKEANKQGLNVKDENLTDEQSTRYKKLLEKQYSNLSYDIKDEKIDGDNAVISTEIKVINYKKAINDTYNYYQGRDDYTVEEYNNTKLKNLEKEKEKVTYTIDFDVKKDKDGNWKIASLSNETIKKIQGMY